MSDKYLIEECFALTPKDVLRSFQRVRRIGAKMDDRRPDIDYHLEEENNSLFLHVGVGNNKPQKIAWEWHEITFGKRAYFRCSCGCRIVKIYLLPNGKEFKCRKCHKLRYELSTINRKSVHGKIFYKTNRLIKLANKRNNMSRIFYNSSYTKKFNSFLRLCDKAGLNNIRKGADNLMELIKS